MVKTGQFQGVSGGCSRVMHGVRASRESKEMGSLAGWNSGGKSVTSLLSLDLALWGTFGER